MTDEGHVNRKYLRRFEGHFSSIPLMYEFADEVSKMIRRLLPDFDPQSVRIYFANGQTIEGVDALRSLDANDRREPVISFIASWRIEATTLWLMLSNPTPPVGMSFEVEGSDLSQVEALAEILLPEARSLARLIDPTADGQSDPPLASEQPAPPGRPVAGPQDGPQASQSTAKALTVISPGRDSVRQWNLGQVLQSQWAVAIGSGLVIWLLTNLQVVMEKSSDLWTFLAGQAWFWDVFRALLSALAGVAISATISATRHRRRKREPGA